jgi:capsular polysaccharide transport system permease protein
MRSLRAVLKVLGCFLPTIAAAGYFGIVAADQYVSEAQFIVRTGKMPDPTGGGLLAMVQLGFSNAQDDTFAVNDFFLSRDAIAQLKHRLPLHEIYNRSEGDALARYPSIFFGPSEEEFFKYYRHMVSVTFTSTTGITTVRVRAFRPDDAQQILNELLRLGEQLVNRMNDRMRADTIRTSVAEVELSQERLIAAQVALTQFRNSELLLNPKNNASSLSGLIANLSAELAKAKAELGEISSGASANPQIPGLRRRIAALEEQIMLERSRITNEEEGPGIAAKLGEYEHLTLELEFARKTLTDNEAELTKARADARRQHLFLQKIALPALPDYATEPQRLYNILTAFAVNLIFLLVGWLILTGVREHGGSGI